MTKLFLQYKLWLLSSNLHDTDTVFTCIWTAIQRIINNDVLSFIKIQKKIYIQPTLIT